MLVLLGSTSVSTAAVATAASIALPPFFSMSSPAFAASGWLVATTPRRPMAGERSVSYGNLSLSCATARGMPKPSNRVGSSTMRVVSRRSMVKFSMVFLSVSIAWIVHPLGGSRLHHHTLGAYRVPRHLGRG